MPDEKDNTPQPSKPQAEQSSSPVDKPQQTNRPTASQATVLGADKDETCTRLVDRSTNHPTSDTEIVESTQHKTEED